MAAPPEGALAPLRFDALRAGTLDEFSELALRKLLAPLTPVESMAFPLERIRQSESNEAFLASLNA